MDQSLQRSQRSVWHADMKRARMQQNMQAEHKVTSAVRAANRRAEAQLLQARQVRNTVYTCHLDDNLRNVKRQVCKHNVHPYSYNVASGCI